VVRSKFIYALTTVLVAQAALFYSASRGEVVPSAAPLSAFPVAAGDWHMAQVGVIDQDTLDVLKADDTLTRWYESPEGGANLFIAFFKTQRQGQSPHSPKNCLPGSGWQPSESGYIDVPLGSSSLGSSSININRYIVSKGEAQSVVLYWYQTQGRVIADEFSAKFYLISDSIRKHRSDTALVRVVVPVANGQTQRAEKIGLDFVKTMYPVVANYLPR